MAIRLLRAVTCIYLFVAAICSSAQTMLGYTDLQGNYYVNDSTRIVHLEHQPIISSQSAAGSIAYIDNSGELIYYSGHEQKKLNISNPQFYRNTDLYLYYSLGGNFSVYNGTERKFLGNITEYPYAFGDSIASFHDYSGYLYAYVDGEFIELEKNPAQKVLQVII